MDWRLFVVLLLLVGCAEDTQNGIPPGAVIPPSAPPDPEPTFQDFYSYDALTNYVYSASYGDVSAEVETDLQESEWSYRLLNTVHAQDEDVVTLMELNKRSLSCLSHRAMLPGETRDMTCPESGLNSKTFVETPPLIAGEEEVAVPVGTFLTDIYRIDTLTFWIAEGVPLPVKISGEEFTMELVSYE